MTKCIVEYLSILAAWTRRSAATHVSVLKELAFEELTLNSPPAHRRAFAQMPRGRSLTVGKGTMRTA